MSTKVLSIHAIANYKVKAKQLSSQFVMNRDESVVLQELSLITLFKRAHCYGVWKATVIKKQCHNF